MEAKAEGGALTVEVASSFRPAVSSRFAMLMMMIAMMMMTAMIMILVTNERGLWQPACSDHVSY